MPPLKSVAVQPIKRGGGRKQPSPTVNAADDDAALVTSPIARSARRVAAAPTHRYRVGDRLSMQGGGQSIARLAGGCKVMALLPYEGRGALLYRVRSDTEQFERIVAEADLVRG